MAPSTSEGDSESTPSERVECDPIGDVARECSLIWKEPVDLMREICGLQFRYSSVFLTILVLVVLPTRALVQFEDSALESIRLWSFVNELSDTPPFEVSQDQISQLLLPNLAVRLLSSVLSIFPNICIIYSVARLKIAGVAVGLRDLAGAVRRLWMRVILTSLCLFALDFGLLFVGASILGALPYTPVFILEVMIGTIPFMIFKIVFQLAVVVTVLEGVYGWKALVKSRRVLYGKVCVSIGILVIIRAIIPLLIWFFTAVLELFFQLILGALKTSTNPSSKAESPWPSESSAPSQSPNALTRARNRESAPQLVKSVAMACFSSMFIVGTQSLLYFKCKDLHQEKIIDSPFFQTHVMHGGYSSINKDLESPGPILTSEQPAENL